MKTANSKSTVLVEESVKNPRTAPNRNIINLNGKVWNGHSCCDATSMNHWEEWSEIPYINQMVQLPVPFTTPMTCQKDTGYQHLLYYMQGKVKGEIRTPFAAANWVKPPSWNKHFEVVPYHHPSWDKHFEAVPYHNYGFVPQHVHMYWPMEHQFQARFLAPNAATGTSTWSFRRGNHVAWESMFKQGLNTPKVQSKTLNYASEDLCMCMDVSSHVQTESEETVSILGQNSVCFQEDTESVNMTSPLNSDKDHGTFRLGHALCSPSESCKNEKGSREMKKTLQEDDNDWAVSQQKKKEFMQNPNPNPRSHAFSIISEVSSTASFECKETELVKDQMLLCTPTASPSPFIENPALTGEDDR